MELSFEQGERSVGVVPGAGVSVEAAAAALASVPFRNWVTGLDSALCVNSVEIQSVDMFGPRVGFVKFKADVTFGGPDGRFVPGIVFMRGGAVAILVVLRVTSDAGPDREFTVLTCQPRVPIGKVAWPEIPAGMLDGDGHFAGVAAKVSFFSAHHGPTPMSRCVCFSFSFHSPPLPILIPHAHSPSLHHQEMKEETGIEINAADLIDMTAKVYGEDSPGMIPSAGGCDEAIRLFLCVVRLCFQP